MAKRGGGRRRCFMADMRPEHEHRGPLYPAGGREDAADWYCGACMSEGSRRAHWWGKLRPFSFGEGGVDSSHRLPKSLQPKTHRQGARVVIR